MTEMYITFRADSDAIITRGIVSLLIKVLSARTPDEIIRAELYFIDRIGLRQNLSPTRSNGLLSMVRQMKLYAMAYKAQGVRPQGVRRQEIRWLRPRWRGGLSDCND